MPFSISSLQMNITITVFFLHVLFANRCYFAVYYRRSLTPLSAILLGKLTDLQLMKKFLVILKPQVLLLLATGIFDDSQMNTVPTLV